MNNKENEDAVKTAQEGRTEVRRKRVKIPRWIIVLAVLAAAFCLWYISVPRSWENIFGAGEGEIKRVSATHSVYHLETMDSSDPAAQVIINALEGRSYRPYLGNLRPDFLLPEYLLNVTGADEIHLGLSGPKTGFMAVTVFSNGWLAIGGATNMVPVGFRSYKTDKGLFQEVFEIVQEYSTYHEWQDVIEPR